MTRGLQEAEAPRILKQGECEDVKIVSPTHRPLLPHPTGKNPGTHSCYKLCRPQSHSATGWIRSTKNSKNFIGNRTRDVTVCSTVPQPNALPCTPSLHGDMSIFFSFFRVFCWFIPREIPLQPPC